MKLDSIVNSLRVHVQDSNKSEVGINDDIRPLPPARRTWGRLAFFSFQAINQVCISNWQVGSSLIAIGLSVWQTMIAVVLGKIIIAIVAVLNGYVGAQWHIGYPVYCRVIWGIYGSYLAIVQRILLSVIWYSIQSWFGGLGVCAILSSMFSSFFRMTNTMPTSTHMTTQEFVGWIVYNLVSIPILYIPPEKTKKIFAVMNSIAFLTLFAMMIWALSSAYGARPLLSEPANVSSGSNLGWAVINGITIVVGTIAVGLTNAPDWARFARKPGD
jgi:nucleobase:cation symporter-1, NCS1 family